MKLSEMRQEVIDRGYHYIKPARIDKFLNNAYRQVCERRPWPFLEASSEGAPPLAIADLKSIIAVSDVAREQPLEGQTARWLSHYYPNLSQSGSAVYFYLEGDTLRTYPASTNKLLVRYTRKPAELGFDDEPLIPEEWQHLLVDRAVADCLKDDDEYAEARVLREDVKEGIEEMAGALMLRNQANDRSMVRTGNRWDYL